MTSRRRPRRYLTPPVGLDGENEQLVRSLKDFLDRPSRWGYLGIRLRRGASVEFRIRPWRRDRLVAILWIGVVDPADPVVKALLSAGWTRKARSSAWTQYRAFPVDLADLSDLVTAVRAIPTIGSSEPLGFFDRAEYQREARSARRPEEMRLLGAFVALVGFFVVVLPVFMAVTALVTRRPPPSREVSILTIVGAPIVGIVFGLLFDRLMAAGYRWRHLPSPPSLVWATPTLGALLWVTLVMSVFDRR